MLRFSETLTGTTYDLGLYSLSGRRIATIGHGIAGTGAVRIEWSEVAGGDRVPAGVYIARLSVDGRTVQQKVVKL